MSKPLPLISLLHPTARVEPSEAFQRGWRDAHDAWMARADHPERIEYVVSVHRSRWEQVPHDRPAGAQKWASFRFVCNDGRDCVVDQLNHAARRSSGHVLMGVMDDYYPPEHWDTLVLEALALRDMPHPSLKVGTVLPHTGDYERPIQMWFSSGSPRDPELIVAGACTRARYEQCGFLLDPDFESMFSDDWHTFCAKRDAEAGTCELVKRLDIAFEHRHPLLSKYAGQSVTDPWEGVPADDVYRLQNRRVAYQQGYATFRRKAYGSRVIAVLMPGETFSHRWVFAMFDVLASLERWNFVVERYGFHSSNVYSTRLELAAHVIDSGTHPDFALWVDDDNVVSPDAVGKLIADLDAHPELAGVVAWCWCDTGDYEDNPFKMSCGRQGPKMECLPFSVEDYCRAIAQGRTVITSDDVAPDAFWSGFPCVLVRGAVLEALGWEAFRPMLGDYRRGFTSEDTTWFRKAFEAGYKFAVDLTVKVPHLKLRGIEPQILPAKDRQKVERYLTGVKDLVERGVDASRVASAAD